MKNNFLPATFPGVENLPDDCITVFINEKIAVYNEADSTVYDGFTGKEEPYEEHDDGAITFDDENTAILEALGRMAYSLKSNGVI